VDNGLIKVTGGKGHKGNTLSVFDYIVTQVLANRHPTFHRKQFGSVISCKLKRKLQQDVVLEKNSCGKLL